ncbi:MAG: UrcA family protein [Pseudomonadota bacterium]
MFKLTQTVSGLASLALAAIPMLALTTAAHAAPMSVKVGDLSSAAGVAAFEQRIDKVAGQVCAAQAQDVGTRMVNTEGCREAVRAEAIDKLTPAQRSQVGGVSQLAAR